MTETNWFHDLTTEESKKERATLAQRVIAILGVLCFIVLVGVATNAYATPVAHNQNECMTLADYGITTRAMVLAGVDLPKRLATLEAMYTLDERMRELAKVVRLAADKSEQSANDFAGLVFKTCLSRQGDISGLIGPSS